MCTMIEYPDKAAQRRYAFLTEQGMISEEALVEAGRSASLRGIEIEKVLIQELRVPRRAVLNALSSYHELPTVEYDEKIPVPPVLFRGPDVKKMRANLWFPLFKEKDTVVIAVNNPADTALQDDIREYYPDGRHAFMVALGEDIRWFIEDFALSASGRIVGVERTGLAYWRNNMAFWRTRLACYRTDLAKARTGLNVMRWGLGMLVLANTLLRSQRTGVNDVIFWTALAAGLSVSVSGLAIYLKIRNSRMRPPTQYTLVEVTGAVISFLEDYHFVEGAAQVTSGKTMLARLADLLLSYSTILPPFPAYQERIHLARERNVLAAQRTVAACYRTIVSQARTGLSFIRSGVALASLGIGLISYFGFSGATAFDVFLSVIGVLMIIDGLLWYWPVRKENAETPRCYIRL